MTKWIVFKTCSFVMLHDLVRYKDGIIHEEKCLYLSFNYYAEHFNNREIKMNVWSLPSPREAPPPAENSSQSSAPPSSPRPPHQWCSPSWCCKWKNKVWGWRRKKNGIWTVDNMSSHTMLSKYALFFYIYIDIQFYGEF